MADRIPKFWCVHTPEATLFLQNNCIAIGWYEMGDLSKIENSREAFKIRYGEVFADAKKMSASVNAGTLYRFCHEMQIGDYVVFPSKSDRMVYLGMINGLYEYKSGERYPQVRSVKWLKHMPRSYFTQGALYVIGTRITVSLIDKYVDEFESAIRGVKAQPKTPPEFISSDALEEMTKDFVLQELSRKLKGYDLEDFVADLLHAMGYRADVSAHGGDSGIDITAYKDEFPPRILVQVKSTDGDVKEQTIMSLKGAMREGDYGLFITLSDYTKNAKEYLKNNPIIRGLNGSDLVGLILEYYEKLDEKYQDIIPLQKVYVPVIVPQEQEDGGIDDSLIIETPPHPKQVHKPPVDFLKCGIPVGATLTYIDDSNICVTVVNNHKVMYNGEVTSMTAVAKRIRNTDTALAGSNYFMYEGKRICEIAEETQWKDFKRGV